MTDEARRAANKMYDAMGEPANYNLGDTIMSIYAAIIDAEFAKVIDKADKYDMALSTTAILQVENSELRAERDWLKGALKKAHNGIEKNNILYADNLTRRQAVEKALRELVEADNALSMADIPAGTYSNDDVAEWDAIVERKDKALAAAEALMKEK